MAVSAKITLFAVAMSIFYYFVTGTARAVHFLLCNTLYLVAIGAFFTIGIMNTITFTIQMDKSRLEAPGTDYTIQNSIAVLGSIIAAALSGVIAKLIGYRGVFGLGLAIAIISVLIIAKVSTFTEKT